MLLPPALVSLQPPVPAVPGPQATATPERAGAGSFARELHAARHREDGAADAHADPAAKAAAAPKGGSGPGAPPAPTTASATSTATASARGSTAGRPGGLSTAAGRAAAHEPPRDAASAPGKGPQGLRGSRASARDGAGGSGAADGDAQATSGAPEATDDALLRGTPAHDADPLDPRPEAALLPSSPAPLPAGLPPSSATGLAPGPDVPAATPPTDTGSAPATTVPPTLPAGLPDAASAAAATQAGAASAAAAPPPPAATGPTPAGAPPAKIGSASAAGGSGAGRSPAVLLPDAQVGPTPPLPFAAAAGAAARDAADAAADDAAAAANLSTTREPRAGVAPERSAPTDPNLRALPSAEPRLAEALGATLSAGAERDSAAGALGQPGQALPSFAAELAHRVNLSGAADAPAPVEMRAPVPVDAPDFLPRLGGELAILARDGVQEARVQLHPVELGPIAVQITLDGQAAQVHLAVDNAHTRALLETAMPTLAAALREQGLTLTGGGVFEQSRQGSGGPAEGTQGRATRAASGEVADDEAAAGMPQPPRGLRRAGGLDLYA